METRLCPALTTPEVAQLGVAQATTVGPRRSVLVQDVQLVEQMQHFNCDWIPEQPVHLKDPPPNPTFTVAGDNQFIRPRMLQSHSPTSMKSTGERRCRRRHDLVTLGLPVDRWGGGWRSGRNFGTIMDLSAGGMRIRTRQDNLQRGNQIRVHLELPAFAGIRPFIHAQEKGLTPMNEWVGWMTVNRIARINKHEYDVAGELIDMDEIDRGMLGLYLSTQPLAGLSRR